MRMLIVAAAVLAAAAPAGCGGDDDERPDVPRTFFGVAPQDATSDVDLARMARGNVGSYHLLLSWARVESSPARYDWSSYDELIGKLAIHDIEPIPYVFGTPGHLADEPTSPPTESDETLRAWEEFLTAAAERYGPGGEFWRLFAVTDPDVEPKPLRIWEIWNEVNGPAFWHPTPDPGDYATLLKHSQRTLHEVDPEARIMVAGMFATPSQSAAIESFEFLREMYEKPNVADAVDLVAVHPYGPRIRDVRTQMARTYREMERAGDGDSAMWVTELGWGSDPDVNSQLTTTPDRQATLLRRSYELLIRKRDDWNLEGALWYTWRDAADPERLCGWCPSAGLVDRDLDPKPAWEEFTKLTGGEP
jgi:hypothetical protein